MSAVFENMRRSFPPDTTSTSNYSPSRAPSLNHSHSFGCTSSLKRFRQEYASTGTLNSTSFYYSSQPRRMTNTVRASNKSAILAVGEELRQLLHAEDPPVIRERRYHLKSYTKCFVGHEMVDWLLKKGEVESRAEAVAMMQKLLENEVIHHGKCMQRRKLMTITAFLLCIV